MQGAHLSKSTLEHDIAVSGCEVAQIFISNPRSYQPPAKDDVLKVNKAGIPLISHLPYLVNIPSFNPDVRLKSSNLLLKTDSTISDNLDRMVVHGGQGGKESTLEEANSRWINFFKSTSIGNHLLIENTAGGSSAPGRNLENLVNLIKELRRFNRVGICFDTCHAYAAGYEDLLEAYLYLKRELGKVDLVHLNDSKDPLDSARDRHELLYKGTIGSANLDKLIKVLKVDQVDMILETPGDPSIWKSELDLIENT